MISVETKYNSYELTSEMRVESNNGQDDWETTSTTIIEVTAVNTLDFGLKC